MRCGIVASTSDRIIGHQSRSWMFFYFFIFLDDDYYQLVVDHGCATRCNP